MNEIETEGFVLQTSDAWLKRRDSSLEVELDPISKRIEGEIRIGNDEGEINGDLDLRVVCECVSL